MVRQIITKRLRSANELFEKKRKLQSFNRLPFHFQVVTYALEPFLPFAVTVTVTVTVTIIVTASRPVHPPCSSSSSSSPSPPPRSSFLHLWESASIISCTSLSPLFFPFLIHTKYLIFYLIPSHLHKPPKRLPGTNTHAHLYFPIVATNTRSFMPYLCPIVEGRTDFIHKIFGNCFPVNL